MRNTLEAVVQASPIKGCFILANLMTRCDNKRRRRQRLQLVKIGSPTRVPRTGNRYAVRQAMAQG